MNLSLPTTANLYFAKMVEPPRFFKTKKVSLIDLIVTNRIQKTTGAYV
jgi:hypothetical protein